MYQSFDSKSDPKAGPGRLERLRHEIHAVGATHFLVPHADEHQNEYQPVRGHRLSWLTGFSGSAGFAIAGLEECVVFVDGRYTLQVREQIDPKAFTPGDLVNFPPSKWLEKNTDRSSVVAYDPWLVTPNQFKAYEKACNKSGASLKKCDNLIDRIWEDQPASPDKPVTLHPLEHAGKSAEQKIDEIQTAISGLNADYVVLSDPASLAWLFNIRGTDVIHNPLPLGFAIVPAKSKPTLFIAGSKLSGEVKSALSEFLELDDSENFLNVLAECSRGKSIHCDPDRIALAISDTIEKGGGKTVMGRDPVSLPRAIKNDTEIQGARNAHIRDGAAMCRFLCWLENQKTDDLDEITAAKQLEKLRIETAEKSGSRLEEISFDTISVLVPMQPFRTIRLPMIAI